MKSSTPRLTCDSMVSGDVKRPTLTTGFPVLDLGIHPEIPDADWRLTLDGLVEHPTTLDWKAFNALPQVEAQWRTIRLGSRAVLAIDQAAL